MVEQTSTGTDTREADWMCVLSCSQLKMTAMGCRRALICADCPIFLFGVFRELCSRAGSACAGKTYCDNI